MRSIVVRGSAALALTASLLSAGSVHAQMSGKGFVVPQVGAVFHSSWYDGPLGTDLTPETAPMFGVQIGVPVAKRVSLVASGSYSQGDLKVGLPLIGGISVGKAKTFTYDVAIELGGLSDSTQTGIAPFVQGGIGGITNDISNSVLDVRATNIAYIAGVGVDMRLNRGLALRLQLRDHLGRFDSQDAVGFRAEGNMAHNIALSAGLKLSF